MWYCLSSLKNRNAWGTKCKTRTEAFFADKMWVLNVAIFLPDIETGRRTYLIINVGFFEGETSSDSNPRSMDVRTRDMQTQIIKYFGICFFVYSSIH